LLDFSPCRIVAVLCCVTFWSTLQQHQHQHPTTTHKARSGQQYTRTGQERNLWTCDTRHMSYIRQTSRSLKQIPRTPRHIKQWTPTQICIALLNNKQKYIDKTTLFTIWASLQPIIPPS
jgi:hypothetical protein